MALIRNNGDIDQREREKVKGATTTTMSRGHQHQQGASAERGQWVNWGWDGGMGATWGVIGKLGGRADSPHYWGWIAFAGRSTVIRVSFSTLDINININININLNISINKSTIKTKDVQCTMCTLPSTMSLYLLWPRY